ncbi:N-acetylmuramoyl-L-alanine amidase [Dysgonomonas sp. ZJ279]|uniref:peptidoglycan recognition protein family protein n=1 Tax=Dysgonomonas sp. ZJ279 TaxID=2709796 RepID=UPI0013EABCB6|nr:peptidoglycan recognition family protein [Dysgonomonas sp. ZJ279]
MDKYKTVFVGIEYTIIATAWSQTIVADAEKEKITWSIVVGGKETPIKKKGISFKYKFETEQQGQRVIFKAFYMGLEDPALVLVYVSKSQISPSWLDTKKNRIGEIHYGAEVHFELLFQNYFFKEPIRFTASLEDKDGKFIDEVFSTGEVGSRVVNNKAGVILQIRKEWRDRGPKDSLFDLYLSIKAEGINSMDKSGEFFYSDDIYKEKLLIKDFFVDDNGFLINPRVEIVEQKNIYRSSSTEFKDPTMVNAVVLHRTHCKTGDSALSTAKSNKQGGHFTVEGGNGVKTTQLSGKDGAIYQFGTLKKAVQHAGAIRKRSAANTPKKQWPASSDASLAAEIKKKYPERFPYNADSIGIEVVGLCLKSWDSGWEAEWEELTTVQIENVAWLTNGLLTHFDLHKDSDLYVHEEIRSKTWDEGGVVLRSIKPYLK